MNGKWVFLMYAKNEIEAQIIKGKLALEGIPVLIQRNHVSPTRDTGNHFGLFEIKILVPELLKNKAEKIIFSK